MYNQSADTVYSVWEVYLNLSKDYVPVAGLVKYINFTSFGPIRVYDWKMKSIGMSIPLTHPSGGSVAGYNFDYEKAGSYLIALGTSNEIPLTTFINAGGFANQLTFRNYGTASIRGTSISYGYGSDGLGRYYPLYPNAIGIPATVSCPTSYIGEMTVITINSRDTSNFYYTLEYRFGNLTGTIISKTKETQIFWQVPTAFIEEMGEATSIDSCEIICSTYVNELVYDGRSGYGGGGWDLVQTLVGGNPTSTYINVLKDVNLDGPLFNPIVVDVNNTTVALTGDNTKLIKYFSNATATSGATGQQGAIITSEQVVNGGTVIKSNTGTFNKVESPIFDFTATDSRGTTTKTQYTAKMVDYSKLTCNILVSTPSVAGNATVVIEGNYFNDSFGAVNNTLTVEYMRYDGGGWQRVEVEPSEYNYRAEFTISGLDYQVLYTFKARATDKLMSIESAEVQSIGKPVYDWGQNDFHVSVAFNADKAINMLPDQSITGTTPEGDVISALVPCDSIGNTVLGYGSYTNETGATKIYGNEVDIIAANGVSINGKTFGGKVLYQGASHMNGNQTANLSEAISDQINGIVLVFSLYRNGAAENVSINSFFVSKKEVELLEGAPHFYFMGINAGFSILGAKYLYIYDTYIQGHEGNTSSSANSGITFNNSNYVLRYVLGV